MWDEFSNLHVNNKTWQDWWHVISKIRFQKTIESVLLLFLLSCLLALLEASCHVVSCPMGREVYVEGTEGGLWPTTIEKLRSSAQQPGQKWILPLAMWVNLEMGPQPAGPWDDPSPDTWIAACVRLWTRTVMLSHTGFLTHCKMINDCCFKPLNFRAICYAAIDS